MGRVIEVDKRLDKLEHQINEVLLMLDELSKVGTKQEHIDIHEKTKETKTDNEAGGASNNKPNDTKRKSKKKSNTDTDGDK